jgi:hypothetical protein
MSEKITYVLRQLNWEGEPVGFDNSNRVVYESYEKAVSMAWYIYRKHDDLYAVQGSDGSLHVLGK